MQQVDPPSYWEQRLRRDYSLAGVGYIGLGQPYNDWLYRVRKHVFRRMVSSVEIDFSRAEVLDIGSGTGFYVERWKEQGVRHVTGVDLTQVAVEGLRRRFPGDAFVQADISESGLLAAPRETTSARMQPGEPAVARTQPGEPARLIPGAYDIVSAFDILFHIVDDERYEQAIRNVAALLKPGGWFVFSENFLHRAAIREKHMVSRTEREITGVMERQGLRMVRRRPMFVLMNYPVDTSSALPVSLWNVMTLPVRANRSVAGFLVGAALYPFELLLTSVKQRSPSTQMAIARKE